jgi:hypothetical protein
MQTLYNGVEVFTDGDTYNLSGDTAKAFQSANVIIKVSSQAQRDGLAALAPGGVLRVPTFVYRTDLSLQEVWDGAAWQRGNGSATPTTGAGWGLVGSLVRTRATAGTQVNAAFRAFYGGGTFTLDSNFVPAFTLNNTGFLPVADDGYGYFVLRAATTRAVKADCAFTIDPTGAVYIRTLLGQTATTVAIGDELAFNTVWNA